MRSNNTTRPVGKTILASLALALGFPLSACDAGGSDDVSGVDKDYWEDVSQGQTPGGSGYRPPVWDPSRNPTPPISIVDIHPVMDKVPGILRDADVITDGDGSFYTTRVRQDDGRPIVPPDDDTYPFHGTSMAEIIHNTAPEATIRSVELKQGVDMGGMYAYLARSGKDFVNNLSVGFANSSDQLNSRDLSNMRRTVDRGMLMLVATGNEADEQPNNFAMGPVKDAHLGNGMLLVTAYESKVANYCGAAADYCVADRDEYGPTNGTSNATARTSALAARIKAKYPWMSNRNIIETIKTTAGDVGPRGIDSKYGWGLVDHSKAMEGYGGFIKPDTELRVQGRDTVSFFGNDLTGMGGMIKTGQGALVLNGKVNDYAGPTRVREGKLVINGRFRSEFEVHDGAELEIGDLKNIETGSILNKGDLTIHGAPLWVRGRYVQGPGAHLNMRLGQGLIAKNDVDLDGYLDLDSTPKDVSYISANGYDYRVVISESGSIRGRFRNVSAPNYLDVAGVSYGGSDVKVTIRRSRASRSLSDFRRALMVRGAPGGLARLDGGEKIVDLSKESYYKGLEADSEILEARFSAYDALHDAGRLQGADARGAATLSKEVDDLGVSKAAFVQSFLPLVRSRSKLHEEMLGLDREGLGDFSPQVGVSADRMFGKETFEGVEREASSLRAGVSLRSPLVASLHMIDSNVVETLEKDKTKRGFESRGVVARLGYAAMFGKDLQGFAVANLGWFGADLKGARAGGKDASEESRQLATGLTLGINDRHLNFGKLSVGNMVALHYDRVSSGEFKLSESEKLLKGSGDFLTLSLGSGFVYPISEHFDLRGDAVVDLPLYHKNGVGYDFAGGHKTVEDKRKNYRLMAGLGLRAKYRAHNFDVAWRGTVSSLDKGNRVNLVYSFKF